MLYFNSQVQISISLYTRKMVPITGRVSSFLEFLKPQSQSNLNPNQTQSIFALLSSSVSKANLSCVVATIFSSLVFPSSSIYITKLSRFVATSFSSLSLLYSSVSTANLRYLLVTTFSSLIFFQLIFITSLQSFCSSTT